ncbi:hypothetical protein [Streptomyces sp. SAI-090]|uniref:hypothetical protein n=1 Tax=Streptomyces sp. SAI-090 TaxID=2940545 RepID=UPI002472E82B|nr:hypothetical protein [Streptomyces sp. SAI-090]MDH6522431.1 hypothetical protein [Streptomyces sp. SAI-090]
MDISELTSAATEALADRESTGKAVISVTVETSRDDDGWISYADTALVTYHDGDTRPLNIRGTALSTALEQHADDEAERGVPQVVIPIPPRSAPADTTVLCEEHRGAHRESITCRWPHGVHPQGAQPQVGHPHHATD